MKKILLASILLIPLIAYGAFETTVFQPQSIYSGVNSTSTSVSAYTLVSGDVVGYSTIIMTPKVSSLTLTLPASSTLSTWIPLAGQRINMMLMNGSSTAGINVGIVAGTGSLIENASTTATTTPQKAMMLSVMRKPNTDFLWMLIPAI